MASIDAPSPRRCLGTTAWALKGGSYCVVHNSQVRAPPAGRDRDPPGGRWTSLTTTSTIMIDQAEDTDRYFQTLKVYSRCIPHLSSLLRTKRSLGDPADDVLDIIGQAVDQVVEEQGWTVFESFNR